MALKISNVHRDLSGIITRTQEAYVLKTTPTGFHRASDKSKRDFFVTDEDSVIGRLVLRGGKHDLVDQYQPIRIEKKRIEVQEINRYPCLKAIGVLKVDDKSPNKLTISEFSAKHDLLKTDRCVQKLTFDLTGVKKYVCANVVVRSDILSFKTNGVEKVYFTNDPNSPKRSPWNGIAAKDFSSVINRDSAATQKLFFENLIPGETNTFEIEFASINDGQFSISLEDAPQGFCPR